jgi:hypothetical protein
MNLSCAWGTSLASYLATPGEVRLASPERRAPGPKGHSEWERQSYYRDSDRDTRSDCPMPGENNSVSLRLVK